MGLISVPGLGSSKCVLMIADDELHIFDFNGKTVQYVKSIPWDEENFINIAITIIRSECGSKPILIVDDSSEQFYRRESIPKIGNPLDRGNLVKRKLNVAFPNHNIKGSILLKDKSIATKGAGAKKDGKAEVKTNKYLFAAIPESQKVSLLVEVVRELPSLVSGYVLLPIESASLVSTLSRKIFSASRAKSMWTIFIGQNQNGGLRQIVTKQGELAMTRLTPVVDTDSEPELWANEVIQEFKATLKYLARFDYRPDDGLDVITVCSPTTGQILDDLIDIPCNFQSLTLVQAADHLGLKLKPVDTKHYVDRLHAGWAARKRAFTINLQPPEIDRISRPRQMVSMASFLMFLSACYFGYNLMGEASTLMENQSKLDSLSRQERQLDAELQQEIEKMDELGLDVKLIRASTSIFEEYRYNGIEPIDYINRIYDALDSQITLKFLTMEVVDKKSFIDSLDFLKDDKEEDGKLAQIKLGMLFPGTTKPEEGNKEVERLAKRLQAKFPGHDVKVSKYLKDLAYDAEIVGESGLGADEQKIVQDFSAEIQLIGRLKPALTE